MESKVKLQHFSVCKSGINGYYFVISVSARSAVSISSCVFHHPKENRIVPVGNVPSVLWAKGAQCSPVRVRIPYCSSSSHAACAGSFAVVCMDTTPVRPFAVCFPMVRMLGILRSPRRKCAVRSSSWAQMAEQSVMERIYRQMTMLTQAARDIMVHFPVHSCTDMTGFALLGHGTEMAQGSQCTIHIQTQCVPYHKEAYPLAEMGFIPAGAYRNREYAEAGVKVQEGVSLAMQDLLYDPQTSGGLLFALPEAEAGRCLEQLKEKHPFAVVVGYVTAQEEDWIVLE